MSKEIVLTEEEILNVEVSYGGDMNVFPVGKSLCLDDILDCDDASEFFSNKGEFLNDVMDRNTKHLNEIKFAKIIVFEIEEGERYSIAQGQIVLVDDLKNKYLTNDTECKNINDVTLFFNNSTSVFSQIGDE